MAAISSWPRVAKAAAMAFMREPYFLPRVLKFGRIFLVINPAVSEMNSASFTLTSPSRSVFTFSSCSSIFLSITGMTSLERGWRTFMFTLRRRASTIDDALCARSILSSRSLSTQAASYTGMDSKCTDPAPGTRSRYILSIKNGAIGAAILATSTRTSYKV